MKKIVAYIVLLVLVFGCTKNVDIKYEYEEETFTIGESLEYVIPVYSSDLLESSEYDYSTSSTIDIEQEHYMLSSDNYIKTVSVDVKKNKLDSPIFPLRPMIDLEFEKYIILDDIESDELIRINDIEWKHVIEKPFDLDLNGEKMITQTHYFLLVKGFELYSYKFETMYDADEKDDKKIDNGIETMKYILSLSKFDLPKHILEEEYFNVLNGEWDMGNSGYLSIDNHNILWYQSSDMDPNNVIDISIDDFRIIQDPSYDYSWAIANFNYNFRTIGGNKSETDFSMKMFFVVIDGKLHLLNINEQSNNYYVGEKKE